jgi:hypothetical protein
MKNNSVIIAITVLFFLYSCSSKSGNENSESSTSNNEDYSNENNSSEYENEMEESNSLESNYNIQSDETIDYPSECGFNDDTYSASVDYYNPNTGHSASYTLDVEVQDCQVVQISFPNGGFLDNSHISPADIDSGGDATVTGENGQTYEIHIDN